MAPSDVTTLAKALPSAVEVATNGALADLREQILPDIDATLGRAIATARDDMWFAVIAVVRGILSTSLGHDPLADEVTRFLNEAAADPAFAARATRLVSEGVRSPSSQKKRMLALALFRPPTDPDVRDRVDLALERLSGADVEHLRRLVEKEKGGRGFKLLRDPGAPGPRLDWMAGRDVVAIPTMSYPGGGDEMQVPVASLFALRAADCVDISEPIGLADEGDKDLVVRYVAILALGRSVLDVLKHERALADIDASANAATPADTPIAF